MKFPSGCLWITGLSAAGKTTVAAKIYEYLNKRYDNIISLDGDELRRIFQMSSASYARDDRIKLGLTYSRLVKELTSQDFFVIIAVIGLYDEIHLWNNENISPYFDVVLNVPMHELEKRDPKGLYMRFRKGMVKNVAGLDFKVDFPSSPFCNIDWDKSLDPESMSANILDQLCTALNISHD